MRLAIGKGVLFAFKKIALPFFLLFLFQSSFCQRNAVNKEPDSMFFFHMGASNAFINRQAFDQWTRANYNLTERYNLNLLIDLGYIYRGFDFGADLSVDATFNQHLVYFGRRLTGPHSFITSWLNFEYGQFTAVFTNIAPINYKPTPDQQGQQLELQYTANYIGLSSRNFFNFLHHTIRIGKGGIPINTGFFVGAGYQPHGGNWQYGYYNKDTVFTAVKIKTIPKLSKVQVTTGVFVGF
ncbi:MAG TPA: hypothetical protein VNX40_11465 [Mucilaginibacter sp.]|nr:hypothetical protein [Mucilaginibacter sp.]